MLVLRADLQDRLRMQREYIKTAVARLTHAQHDIMSRCRAVFELHEPAMEWQWLAILAGELGEIGVPDRRHAQVDRGFVAGAVADDMQPVLAVVHALGDGAPARAGRTDAH